MGSTRHVLVGTRKGLFRISRDERHGWRSEGPMLSGWEVSTVWAAPGGERMIVGTTHFVHGASLRESNDGGATWTEVEQGPAYPEERGRKLEKIWRIERSRHDPTRFYCGVAEAGLFESRDDGATWQENLGLVEHPTYPDWQPGMGGLCLHSIVEHATDPRQMWVGISAVGVLHTRDGGASWQVQRDGIPQVVTGDDDVEINRCVHRLEIDPTNPERLFMQYHGGVFRSDDGGEHWVRIEHGLDHVFGFPMVVHPDGTLFVVPLVSDMERRFADGRVRVFRSRDAGETWDETHANDAEGPVHAAVLRDAMCRDDHPDAPGVYLGTSNGLVFGSLDQGETWDRLPGFYPRISSVRAVVGG